MAKKFTGLDGMITPTTHVANAAEREMEQAKGQEDTSTKEKKYINSNIPLLEEQHIALRIIAMKRGKTLRELLPEIIGEWLQKQE